MFGALDEEVPRAVGCLYATSKGGTGAQITSDNMLTAT